MVPMIERQLTQWELDRATDELRVIRALDADLASKNHARLRALLASVDSAADDGESLQNRELLRNLESRRERNAEEVALRGRMANGLTADEADRLDSLTKARLEEELVRNEYGISRYLLIWGLEELEEQQLRRHSLDSQPSAEQLARLLALERSRLERALSHLNEQWFGWRSSRALEICLRLRVLKVEELRGRFVEAQQRAIAWRDTAPEGAPTDLKAMMFQHSWPLREVEHELSDFDRRVMIPGASLLRSVLMIPLAGLIYLFPMQLPEGLWPGKLGRSGFVRQLLSIVLVFAFAAGLVFWGYQLIGVVGTIMFGSGLIISSRVERARARRRFSMVEPLSLRFFSALATVFFGLGILSAILGLLWVVWLVHEEDRLWDLIRAWILS